VNSGYARYLSDDTMLATVVAPELAHNIFWRPSANRRGSWASRKSEARADDVGLYLLAMAGYPLNTETRLLSGLTEDVDYFTARRRSHPTSPARVLAERKTIEEINEKQRRGEPLRLRFK
jgi:predicted Zn-dependent protease